MALKTFRRKLQAMLGYIIAAIIAILVIGFAFSALGGTSPPDRKRKPGQEPSPKPVGYDRPSADEPTPDRSRTASSHQVETAKHHTPPA